MQIDDAHIASCDEHDASTDYGMTEGMTLLLLDTAKAAPDLWSSPNQHEEADRHEVGHLSFVTKDTSHRSSNVNVKELPKKPSPGFSKSRLPTPFSSLDRSQHFSLNE